MQFRHLFAIACIGVVGLVGSAGSARGSEPEANAEPTSDADVAPTSDASTDEATEELNALSAGHGCSGFFSHSDSRCARYCRRIGFKAGYCDAGRAWLVCRCTR